MATKTNPKSRPNLTRFSYESTGFKGWRVSVTRHGEVFTRYFSDRKFGTMKKSQDAAQNCLAAFVTELDKVEVLTSKRKSTGRPMGISESVTTKVATGEERVVWIASWPEDGRRRVVKFPVSKFGARQAKQLATKARKDAEDRLGLNVVKQFRREDITKLRELLETL